MGVDISVLTPVFNEADLIRETVAAMRNQRFDGQIEYLLIDGGSDDGTRQILEELAANDSRFRILDNPKRQIPAALNIGLRHAAGAVVVRMDAHTTYPPDYIARGVARLRQGDVDWVSGPQLAHGNGRWSRPVALALRSWLGVGEASFRRATEEIYVDTGFTGMWHKATLDAHGGWDERWPVNEDAELAARVRRSGGRIACLPELAAHYSPRDSPGSLARQYWRYGQYRAKTSRRHPESMRRSHILPVALALSVIASVKSPAPLAPAARGAVSAYGAVLAAVTARLCHRAAWSDAPRVIAVFAVMHLSWGFGFLAGCVRFGPPVAAFARALSPRRGARGSPPRNPALIRRTDAGGADSASPRCD